MVSSRGQYRLTEKFFIDFSEQTKSIKKGTGNMIVSNIFDTIPDAFLNNKQSDNMLTIYGRTNNERVVRFIKNEYVINNSYLNTYNVLIPEANGTGAFGETLSSPFVCAPEEGATDTFVSLGLFNNYSEAENLRKYTNTKFLRALLSIKKATQHTSKNVWEYVPIQDFTNESDIDWNVSITDIDKQLYLKYGLVENEISFIEKSVKEM